MRIAPSCVALVVALAGTGPAVAQVRELLPDLVQEPPTKIAITRVGTRHHLGFRSAVHNIGPGPFIVRGVRPSTDRREMRAWQVVQRTDGTRRVLAPAIGVMTYIVSPDHAHWHYRPFERYFLLTDAGAPIGRDGKSGFCLGDRYRAAGVVGAIRPPVFTGACGLRQRGLLGILEGISRGWGDDYAPQLEGQSIDVTGLPAGRYRLVHVVNRTRRVRERSYANNTAITRIELQRTGGVVRVRVLGPG